MNYTALLLAPSSLARYTPVAVDHTSEGVQCGGCFLLQQVRNIEPLPLILFFLCGLLGHTEACQSKPLL